MPVGFSGATISFENAGDARDESRSIEPANPTADRSAFRRLMVSCIYDLHAFSGDI